MQQGLIRKLDNLGRIVIPIEIRKNMGIREGSSMEIIPDADGILIKKYVPDVSLYDKLIDLKNTLEFSEVDFDIDKLNEIRSCLFRLERLLNYLPNGG